MTKAKYLTLKRQLEAELRQAESTADGIRRKLDSLNVVWSEILSPSGSIEKPSDIVNDPTVTRLTPVLASEIDEIALAMVDQFSVHNIATQLSARGVRDPNRTTISGRLAQLANDGKLELVQRGQGRRASVFRVKRKESEPQQKRHQL